jgi:hypothetical protein
MNEEEAMIDREEPENQQNNIDPGLLNTLIKAGENKEGMISLDKKEVKKKKEMKKEEPLFKEEDEDAKLKPGKVSKKLGKYTERFLFDMKKNPDKYMIDTPRGKMSVQDAIKQGYDPATKDFTDETPDVMIDKKLSGLSKSGKEKIKSLLDPKRAQVPAEEAATMGVEEGSPLVAGQEPAPTGPQQGAPQEGEAPINPEMLAMLGGGQ